MARAFLLQLSALATLFLIFAPTPKEQKSASSFIYSNPLISKAALGAVSPLAADFAWLESTKIGEMGRGGSEKVDKNEIKTAFLTIASLDPTFFHAINYGTTFLSTIAKDKEAAFVILDRAIAENKDDFRLYYLKLITELTADNPDKKTVKELAKIVFLHPEFTGVFGVMKIDDFVLELLSFSENEEAKKKHLKDELLWLHKNTKDKNKKALIESKLRELN